MSALTMYKIWEQYIVEIAYTIFLIFLGIQYLKGFTIFDIEKTKRFCKYVLQHNYKKPSIKEKETMAKLCNNKKVRICEIVIFLIISILLLRMWFNNFLDLPNVILNNYETIECITTTGTGKDADGPGKRLDCANEKGKIYIKFYASDNVYIPKGTVIKVNYYRHLEIGYITSIQD